MQKILKHNLLFFIFFQKMAKIYKYRGLSTRKHNIESLEEFVELERPGGPGGHLERPGGQLSPSFNAQVSLFEPQ